jgi:phosphatidylinositol-3-phosphatase
MLEAIRRGGALAVFVLLIACTAPVTTGPSPSASGTSSVAPSVTPTVTPSPTPISLTHVFVIVMENRSLETALQTPAIASLASTHALATNYHAVARPSLPNYLAMTSGSIWNVSDNDYHALPAGGIGAQLTAAGVPWRAYTEGLTAAGCFQSPYPYALKHNPFAYYGGGCPANVVPFEALEPDLAGNTPKLVWITPGLCHDGHDCSLAVAGQWLAELVERIKASAAWRDRGVLFIVWDEAEGDAGTRIPLIAVMPGLVAHRTAELYDHYSLLATIQDLLGVPRLGAASRARPLTELLSPRVP